MVRVELQAITQPVGILRVMAAILTCMCFSLVASAGVFRDSYWAWCMFTWCFCFFFTFLIVILEFTTVNTKLPFAWEDFTAAHAMLASLMIFSVSIIYPTVFASDTSAKGTGAYNRLIGASVVSWVCLLVYAGEVVITHLRPRGETSGFLSTMPGIFKMLETFIACLIFASLVPVEHPGLRWCVAVYCLCFIFAIIIILLSLGRLESYFPFSFDKLVIVYNVLATVMYITAVVIWPLYSFIKSSHTCAPGCNNKLVAVTILAILNCIVYILDSAYSIYLVYLMSRP